MKELTNVEMQHVSGAILFTLGGSWLGSGIGKLIDMIIPDESNFSVANACVALGTLGGIAIDALGVLGTLGVVGAVGVAGVAAVGAAGLAVGALFLI